MRVRDLIALVGGDARASVMVSSIQRDSPYATSVLDAGHAADELTLIALRVEGDILHPDNGYPARLIGPNRPGVMQTKWVNQLRVVPA